MLTTKTNIFSPDLYRFVRRTCKIAETLPYWCYTSNEWLNKEIENIFLPGWNLLGRTEQIPKEGDYFTRNLLGRPIIIMRGQDGSVRRYRWGV